MTFLLQLCLLKLLLGITFVHSDDTTPLLLQDEDQTTFLLLQDEETTPLLLQGDGESGPISEGEQLSPEELLELVKERYFELGNPTHDKFGEELVDGDMLLTKEQKELLAERKAIPSLAMRWTNGPAGNPLVPYMFNDTTVDQSAVLLGIAHWEQHTCIRFTPATNLSAPHLKFYYGSGCSSYIGMLPRAGQEVSLGNGCSMLGTVAHEIGHAMGFFHEQSRSDRDNYVVINYANIISNRFHNFRLEIDNNYSVPYDYSSDMHYGAFSFTNNGLTTLATKDFFSQPLIGQRSELSHRDKLLANRMYPCITSWLAACGLATDPCLNYGYTGASCTCVCPPGTAGTRCEIVTGEYYGSLRSTCTENVTTAGNITSPNYPSVYPANLKCTKVIQAPSPCYTIQLTFNSFQLYGQNPYCNNTQCCYFDLLEIRTTDPYSGPVYCGTMISPGQIFTSNTGQMILNFNTVSNYYTGWSATVSFIYNDTACPPSSETSTSTSTSTTPTSTSTTTTSTSTTTTSTSTTSTSTSTTTTPPSARCGVARLASGAIQWTSPGFGLQNYPNSYRCTLNISCTTPLWMVVTLNTFRLETMVNGVCKDYVAFARFFKLPDITYCGAKSLTFNVPSCNQFSIFLSNSAINAQGFNITFLPRTSSCHKKIITGPAGSTGTITVPTPSTTWQLTGCEWWIESPVGTVIKMQFIKTSLSGNCAKTSILLNGVGARGYPAATSRQNCGTAIPPMYTSSTNRLNMMYYATVLNSPLTAKWTVVSSVSG